jgi:hypothetical protein
MRFSRQWRNPCQVTTFFGLVSASPTTARPCFKSDCAPRLWMRFEMPSPPGRHLAPGFDRLRTASAGWLIAHLDFKSANTIEFRQSERAARRRIMSCAHSAVIYYLH